VSSASDRFWPVLRALSLHALVWSGWAAFIPTITIFAVTRRTAAWPSLDASTGQLILTPAVNGVSLIIGQITSLALFLLAWRFLERKSLRGMLLDRLRVAWRPFLLGILSALATIVTVGLLMMASGSVHLTLRAGGATGHASLAGVCFILAAALIGPFTEEIESRGYLFQAVSRGWGGPTAVIATAIVFAARHLQNPHASAIGIVNIVLISIAITLGMLFLRSLWYAIGWHVAWNSSLIFLFGSANSGFSPQAFGISGISLFSPSLTGSDFVTGGAFGMEGSIVVTGVLALEVVLLWRIRARSA